MTISSRTPEGLPNECPVCQQSVTIEPSLDTHDATCPHCGYLLWFADRSENNEIVAPVYSDLRSAANSQPTALPDDFAIPLHVLELVPASVARECTVVPLTERSASLVVAFCDPVDWETYDKLCFTLNCKIQVVHTTRCWIEEKIEEYYGQS